MALTVSQNRVFIIRNGGFVAYAIQVRNGAAGCCTTSFGWL